VLDFTNPKAVAWYRGKLGALMRMGVSVIKADFGEGAPLEGVYANGRTGWYEHNLYPVRYNDVVWNLQKEITGDGIIWGPQRVGGQPALSAALGRRRREHQLGDGGRAARRTVVRLSGFTFWSHDVGGFVNRAPRDLYRRWMAFGALTSHMRTHGAPPREPWGYDDAMVKDWQNGLGMRYSLIPYIYAQSHVASAKGWPMLRTLFFEYPNDPTSWTIEDEYMLGANLLVAPLFTDSATSRRVYLPPGTWIDYQSGRAYAGARWHDIPAGTVPIVALVKDPRCCRTSPSRRARHRSTGGNVELRTFSSDGAAAEGNVHSAGRLVQTLRVNGTTLVSDPLAGA
jgi:alpha-D-xyloside xylohydrolase